MPTDLIWSNQARTDLLENYVAIGIDNPAAAERYFDRIEAKIELLRSRARIGVRRPDIRAGMRMLVEAPYVILYRTEPDTDEGPVTAVEVIRIIDGRRDLGHLFRAPEAFESGALAAERTCRYRLPNSRSMSESFSST
jgi:toxin ParE1/3/4